MNPELEAIANGLTSVCNYLREQKEQLSSNPLFSDETTRNEYLKGIVNECMAQLSASDTAPLETDSPEPNSDTNVNSTIGESELLSLIANTIRNSSNSKPAQSTTIEQLSNNWKI